MYKHKVKDKVKWNKRIFRKCPFVIDEIKEVYEIRTNFIGIEGIIGFWNWWELEPISIIKKPVYWIKFYYWYWTKFKKW